MQVKVKRKTNNLQKLEKRIRELAESKVESGYFPEQGDHPTANMPYGQLMAIHELGLRDLDKRPVRLFAMKSFKNNHDKTLKELRSFVRGESDVEDVLQAAGKEITMKAVDIFGGPRLKPNSEYTIEQKGFDSPLIEFGYLKSAWSWKDSETGLLKNWLDEGGF